jgi:ABC-type glutathione transport system ATPase component
MLGLTPIEGGRIAFDGAPVDAGNREAMARLRRRGQFVFQDPYAALNPRMTVGAALREVLKVHGRPEGEAKALLAEVGLEAVVAGRRPGGLSGGQRARVVIARALAVHPEFLVLDESVAALDTAIREAVLQLLDRLARERGLTYVFISHDLEVVAAFCDRVAVMHLGQIVELGTAARVMTAPEHPYTQRLLASQPGQILHHRFE